MITGTLSFKGIEFTFVLEQEELHLIPPKEKYNTIEFEWKLKKLGPDGPYVPADPIYVTESQLVGKCNETGRVIVFLPKQGADLGFHNNIVIIELVAYVQFDLGAERIDRAELTCSELNYIYRVNQGVSYNMGTESDNNGIIGIETPDYEYTTTEKQSLNVFGKQVSMCYGISRTIRLDVTQTPVSLASSLVFDFEGTDDFSFIFNLYRIARSFIRFCCYRRNIHISNVVLSSPYKDVAHLNVATMHIFKQEGEVEEEPLKKGRFIKQDYLCGKEGRIITDIANNRLYMRHWPDSYESSKHINEARFVMITAAFEWEFKRLYPNGIKKSEKTIIAEDKAIGNLNNLANNSKGKEKRIYKRLAGYVKSDSLQPEISHVGKELAGIITVFGEHLYRLNGEDLNYNEMGKRLAKQRNDFAHGNLDKDFDGLAFLDLIFMERIIYAMQLKYYGVEDKKIQKSINDLFRSGIMIKYLLNIRHLAETCRAGGLPDVDHRQA